MKRCASIAGLVFLATILLSAPGRAEAQGGRWDWIQKMSGPQYDYVLGVAFGYCLNSGVAQDENGEYVAQRCLELGTPVRNAADPRPGDVKSGYEPQFALGAGFIDRTLDRRDQEAPPQVDLLVTPGQRPTIEWMIVASVSGGWNGDNADNDIREVKLLDVTTALQGTWVLTKFGGPFASIGLGVHRFWGGTVPEPFWNPALIPAVGWRFEFLHKGDGEDWRSKPPRLLVSAGLKLRYFFDAMDSAMFGGTPDPDESAEGGEWVYGFVVGVGYRFNWLSGS